MPGHRKVTVTHTTDDDARDAAASARYRQRRLSLLAVLLLVTVLPIIALGAWWLWPLLVIPAAVAAPLAGGTGLIATLLACAIALAAASGGEVTSAEVAMGFIAIVVVAALGAAHSGMARGITVGMPSFSRASSRRPAPEEVFDIVAARDCRRAAEAGSPVSVVIVAVPRADSIAQRHGAEVLDSLLDACSAAVDDVTSGSDLVMEQANGRYVALVPGTAEAARDLGERLARALEAVAVRDHDGLRVTAGSVGVGVAQWRDGDAGPDALIERAGAALQQDMVRASTPAEDQVTGEFRRAAISDAA